MEECISADILQRLCQSLFFYKCNFCRWCIPHARAFFSINKTFAADAFLWLVNFWKLQARAFFLAHIYQSKQATISDQSLNLSLYKVTKVTKGPRDAIWALSWRLSNSIFFYKKSTFYAKCMLVGLFQKNRYKKKI